MTGRSYRVFLSHSKQDSWVCECIGQALTQVGIETCYDAYDFDVGRDIGAEVKEGIQNSDELLILLPPASVNSDWVRHKAGIADALDLPITLVLMHVTLEQRPAPLCNLLAITINELPEYVERLRKQLESEND